MDQIFSLDIQNVITFSINLVKLDLRQTKMAYISRQREYISM